MLLVTPNDQGVREELATQLGGVEQIFAQELVSDLGCVNTLVMHVERYRGKMLRPTLVLLSGMASAAGGKPVTQAHRLVAAVMEMVHMATLVHDDILDEAQIRRRGATINHLRGNEAAVMLGDYLLSHAYHLCAKLDDPDVSAVKGVSRVLSEATNLVCEGELLQLANRNNWDLDELTYYDIIRRKTAALCGACCKVGGLLSEAPPKAMDMLYEYGMKLGVAFQMVDDLLDLTGREETVGKTLGRDLQKGKLTLPLIHFLASAPEGQRRHLRDMLECSSVGEHAPAIRQMVSRSDSIEYTRLRAGKLLREATAALTTLSATPARELLGEVAEKVLTREF